MSRISHQHASTLNDSEWDNLVNLRSELTEHPTALGSDAMELFTELFVRSLSGKGDPPFNGQFEK